MEHNYIGYFNVSIGKEILEGYKPDVVLQNGNKYLILESETSTSRKGFIGNLIKAAFFLKGERSGKLVIVMEEKDNTTVRQIADHLRPYYYWLQNLTNLNEVYVIKSEHYCPDDSPLILMEKEFKQLALKL